MSRITRRWMLAACAAQWAVCGTSRADVVTQFNDALVTTIAEQRTSPPEAARALAMVHAAMHDAINAIEPAHRPLRVAAEAPEGASAEAAAAQAGYRVLVHVYPAQRANWDELLKDALDAVPEEGKQEGIDVGNLVGRGIVSWRHGDGSQRRVRYTPGTRPGDWRPTPPGMQAALLPHWPRVTPFAISYGSQFRGSEPPKLTSANYARDFNEVKRLGAKQSSARTADQTAIARFWADGPGTSGPPGHWNRIARTVADEKGNSLAENARLFALLNVALADAAIACWDMKFTCHLWRPITAIREADTDENPHTEADPDWEPLLETPPFPSCASGHSTFSGAAAEMLSLFFGADEIAFSDRSEDEGQERKFVSFSHAADEAGRSRIFGGIHFELDNQLGLSSGRSLARFIFANYLRSVSEEPDADALAIETFRKGTGQDDTEESGPALAGRPGGQLEKVLRPDRSLYDGEQSSPSDEGWRAVQTLSPVESAAYLAPGGTADACMMHPAIPWDGSARALYAPRSVGYPSYYLPNQPAVTTYYGGWPAAGSPAAYGYGYGGWIW